MGVRYKDYVKKLEEELGMGKDVGEAHKKAKAKAKVKAKPKPKAKAKKKKDTALLRRTRKRLNKVFKGGGY